MPGSSVTPTQADAVLLATQAKYGPEAALFIAKPPRVLLQNLATGEEIEAPLNPNKLPLSISPKWTKAHAHGHTSQAAHYAGTEDIKLDLEFVLFWHLIEEAKNAGTAIGDLMEYEKFLLALTFPVADESSVGRASPPKLLLVWPYTLSMVFRVESLKLDHEDFSNVNLQPLAARAQVSMTSVRTGRITSEFVRQNGFWWGQEVA